MLQPKPSLKQLEYFLAVAECESFRRAAERAGVSQPTITAQVVGLEKRLGVQLFERSRSGTRLSPVGRQLVAYARRVLEEVDGLVEAADSVRHGPGGTYRLGVPPTLGPYILPHVLPELHERYAKLRLYVREVAPKDLELGLEAGRYDLILTPLPLASPDFVITPLFREPVKLVIPTEHRLAGKAQIMEADLEDEDVLIIEEHHHFHRQIQQLCERLGARMRRDYEGTSLDTLRVMVVMGMGLAFLPALYVASEIRAPGELRIADVEGATVVRTHAMVWRRAAPARAFFHSLVREMREIVRRRLGNIVVPVE